MNKGRCFMKKIIAAVVLMLSALMLAACTSSSCTATMCIENTTNTGWEITYEKLNGTKIRNFTVPDSSECIISGVMTTESGSADIEIRKKDGTVIYSSAEEGKSGNFSFEVMIRDGGQYRFCIIADNHKGSVEVELPVSARTNA